MKTTGADLMATLLERSGIEIVAGIPGHTVASLGNAVGKAERLRPMLVRHEAIGSFVADAYYRVSGRLMAVFTHAFPGLVNGLIGVSNAYADSSAMLLISGQTASAALGRGAYQEFSRQFDGDTTQLLRHTVKRVWQPHSAVDLIDKTYTAVRLATAGRPGPVALDVFQNIWDEELEIDHVPEPDGYLFSTRTAPDPAAVETLRELLDSARRPLILAGAGVLLGRARQQLRRLAEGRRIPVATTISGKGAFPEDHELSVGVVGWVGSAAANWTTANADLIVCLGARLSETTASSWQPGATFSPATTRFVQIDADQSAIANAYPVEAALVGDIGLALDALESLAPAGDAAVAGATARRADWSAAIASELEAWRPTRDAALDPGSRGQIGVGHVVRALRETFHDDPLTIVCDIGKHHKWIAQQFVARDDDRVLSSMQGGAMGFGPAGAIGAAMGRPEARTVCWTGDGGMSMALPAWLTAAEYELPITYIVINDQGYGAVANIQKAHYGSTIFSEFDGGGQRDTPFEFNAADIAAGCGIPARTVDDPGAVDDALAWAHGCVGPSVLDIRCAQSSVVPAGGGAYLHDFWNHRSLPPVDAAG